MLRQSYLMRIHTTCLRTCITRTSEFERKGLAAFAVNVGTKCGHLCSYCSTGALLRMHPSFRVADDAQAIEQLIEFGLQCGMEEVFVEPINAGGPGLKTTEGAFREAGYLCEAEALAKIRSKEGWASYATELLNNVQQALRRFDALEKLRSLLYPSRLTPEDERWIRDHSQGVRWLGKNHPLSVE
jgi:hypothetical protein